MPRLPDGLTADEVRSAVRDRYSQVGADPAQEFSFPVGRRFAEAVGYPVELLTRLPPAAAEAFAGVACPVSQAALTPGETVVDLGCGGGLDSLYAGDVVGPSGYVNGIFNLNPDKQAVLAEVYRVLKPGGRLVAAEIVLTAPLPPEEGHTLDDWFR